MRERWTQIDEDELCFDRTEEGAWGKDELPDNLTVEEAWEAEEGDRQLVLYESSTHLWVVRAYRVYKGCQVLMSRPKEKEAEIRGYMEGMKTGWDGISTFSDEDGPPNPSEAELCPFCASRQDWKDPDEFDSTWQNEDDRLQFNRECRNCGGLWATIDHHPREDPRDYATLMFVPEKEDDEHEERITGIKAVKMVECGDPDDPGVKGARAEYNMMYGGCSEVHGIAWAIKDFYRLLVEHYDFDIERSGEDSLEWIPGHESGVDVDEGGDEDGE